MHAGRVLPHRVVVARAPHSGPHSGHLAAETSVRPDALALVEIDSVAIGLRAVDALVKRAPVRLMEANLIEPGRFLVLFEGGVAEVEESLAAARAVAGD